jgi:hypothetical protein
MDRRPAWGGPPGRARPRARGCPRRDCLAPAARTFVFRGWNPDGAESIAEFVGGPLMPCMPLVGRTRRIPGVARGPFRSSGGPCPTVDRSVRHRPFRHLPVPTGTYRFRFRPVPVPRVSARHRASSGTAPGGHIAEHSDSAASRRGSPRRAAPGRGARPGRRGSRSAGSRPARRRSARRGSRSAGSPPVGSPPAGSRRVAAGRVAAGSPPVVPLTHRSAPRRRCR